jgi:hypothetical protein
MPHTRCGVLALFPHVANSLLGGGVVAAQALAMLQSRFAACCWGGRPWWRPARGPCRPAAGKGQNGIAPRPPAQQNTLTRVHTCLPPSHTRTHTHTHTHTHTPGTGHWPPLPAGTGDCRLLHTAQGARRDHTAHSLHMARRPFRCAPPLLIRLQRCKPSAAPAGQPSLGPA